MADREALARHFEASRARLHGVAWRMLGTQGDAEDAVQEAWLRLDRSDVSGVDNLDGWLTTVLARVCLDMLRARRGTRGAPSRTRLAQGDGEGADAAAVDAGANDPEHEAVLADAVGLALLVVLDTLTPAERLAFVLHDLFDRPFEEIAGIVGRTPEATRQLASRARRRVRGATPASTIERDRQRRVVDAFVKAAREGDLAALLAVLDPDAVIRIDAAAANSGATREVMGAANWAPRFLALSRGLPPARLALLDGAVGLVAMHDGHVERALAFTSTGGRLVRLEVIGDPRRLRAMAITLL